MRAAWQMIDDGEGVLTHARHAPLRWDVWAETEFPPASRRRLARAVRQDMWRLLQDLRGFRPIIRVTAGEGGCAIRAGGDISGRFPRARIEAALADLLSSPVHRARWLAYAGRS